MSDQLPPTVVEIRCPCKRGFSIRTNQSVKQRLCNNCERAYIARLYANGVVTVHFIEKGGFKEEEFGREHWSKVTDGE